MPLEALEMTVVLPTTPERIYEAWLDSKHHSAFTGSPAAIESFAGGSHTAWDGYIRGKNLHLVPGARIVQSWRTTEFPDTAADSRLELVLTSAEGGTLLTLLHSEIPEGQSNQYRDGWKEYYFDPMVEYFANLAVSPAVVGAVRVVAPPQRKPVAAKKAAPKKKAVKKAAPRKKTATKRKAARKVVPKKKAAKKSAAKKKTKSKSRR